MVPGAKSQDLLYVSNSDGAVYVYSYPEGKKVGRLSGVGAFALCSDGQGNVWMGEGHKLVEYEHGGTTPIKTLSDPYQGAGYKITSCAVDPVSGNLAIVNFGDFGTSSPGNVAIFKNASGSPLLYCCQLYPIAGSYDDDGDYFVWGRRCWCTHKVVIGELAPKAAKFRLLQFHQHVDIASPGGLQWDGKHVVLGSNSGSSGPSTLYRFSIRKGLADRVGAIRLEGSFGVGEFWIHGARVSGANWGSTTAMIWRYPHSGSPVVTLRRLSNPYGVAVSVARPG